MNKFRDWKILLVIFLALLFFVYIFFKSSMQATLPSKLSQNTSAIIPNGELIFDAREADASVDDKTDLVSVDFSLGIIPPDETTLHRFQKLFTKKMKRLFAITIKSIKVDYAEQKIYFLASDLQYNGSLDKYVYVIYESDFQGNFKSLESTRTTFTDDTVFVEGSYPIDAAVDLNTKQIAWTPTAIEPRSLYIANLDGSHVRVIPCKEEYCPEFPILWSRLQPGRLYASVRGKPAYNFSWYDKPGEKPEGLLKIDTTNDRVDVVVSSSVSVYGIDTNEQPILDNFDNSE